MELVRPSIKYKDSYLSAVREFQAEGRKQDFDLGEAEKDFGTVVERFKRWEEGRDRPDGYVPETVYWLVDGDEYIGGTGIRHTLTEKLQQTGGHIGYDIRPSLRKRGYGREILKLALIEAKKLGIDRALLTCDECNIASRKIIEKNGGVLENKVPNPAGGPDKLRFWIPL